MAARRQLEEMHQASQQQEQQAAEVGQQLAALRGERAAVASEAHSAQQELQRVLRELEQCQKVSAHHYHRAVEYSLRLAGLCAGWMTGGQADSFFAQTQGACAGQSSDTNDFVIRAGWLLVLSLSWFEHSGCGQS
jgi:broad specificity phosphatase PhoE